MKRWLHLFVVIFLSLGMLGATCPPSPNNSTLSAGTSAVLTDSLSQGWGIPKSGGKVFLQGTSLQTTPNAIALAYAGGVMWYENASLQWFSLTSTGQIASGPQVGPPTNGAETITVNAIATQTAATNFVVSGTIANATSIPTLQYSVNGGAYQSLTSGAPPISSPLTGAVTTGSWVVNQQLTSFANGPGGKPLQYNYLLPSGYDPVHFSYPLMFVGAGNDQGMNGSTYPVDGGTFVPRMESDNFRFNTVQFRTAHPAIIVAPQCDQTLDLSGATFNANCGGYNDAANTSWAEQAISALQKHFVNDVGVCGGTGKCSVDPTRKYGVGLSLSAIGYLAQVVDNNQINNQGNAAWTAGVGMSTQLFRPATPNANVFSRMRNVPYFAICAPGDNPCNYDLPFWQSITGNTNYPTQNQYDANFASTQAGTTAFHLIGSYNGGTAYNQFGCMNGDGVGLPCDGTAIYAWLFQQASSGTPSGANVTQTSFSFTVPGMAAATANTISVRDANNTSVVGTSNTFVVNSSGGPTLSGTPKSPLPSGYLHTSGNQILDGGGNNVRLSCSGYGSPTGNYSSDMSIMRNQGFNCARYDLYGAQVCPGGSCTFSTLDQVVSAATANNMKLVLDYHVNELGCGGGQPNGLWYDLNSTTPVAGVTWNALLANGDGCTVPTVSGNFSISGGYLHDPTGATFIPEGTNVDNFEINNVIQNSSGFPITTLMPHINYLRINVCGEAACSQNGSNGSSQPTSINYQSASSYLQLATWCQANRIACEFEDHTSNGGFWEFSNLALGNSASLTPTGSLLTSITNFWASMAAQFKNNPYAWIGTLNELGSYPDPPSQSAYHLALYNAIRATGNNNVIDLCSGAGCGASRGFVGAPTLVAADYANMTNVIWHMHWYQNDTVANVQAALVGTTVTPQNGGPGCYGYTCIQVIHSRDGVMPVVVNEWGPPNGQVVGNQGQNEAIALTNLESAGLGQGAFNYFEPSCPSVPTTQDCFTNVNNGGTHGLSIGSGGYSLTNPWGQQVAAVIAANPFPGGNGAGGGTPVNSAPGLPPGVGSLVFSDNFTSLSLHNCWQAGDNWGVITPGGTCPKVGQGGPNFAESGDQWWVNPFNTNTPISGIYGTDANGLKLGLLQTPSAYQSYINTTGGKNLPYVGGLLNSYNSSYQKYGYWSITVAVPAVPGFSFQMDTENVQITGQFPPEIDLRINTNQSGTKTVLFEIALGGAYTQYTRTDIDITAYHTYGWKWAPDFITFYIDGAQVFQSVTPANANYTSNPMFTYLLTGANYIGNGDPSGAALPVYASVSNFSVYALGASGTTGATTYSSFKSDWTQIAQHYAGNSTVVAMDLWNEPVLTSTYQNPTVNWGGNNGADVRLMCSDVGAAVESADPGVLVICEGPYVTGTFLNGTAFQPNTHNFMDLSLAGSRPVTLAGDAGSHVVYSVHDFPQFGQNPPWLDSGPTKITMMNTAWGYLEKNNTAPVWLGAMGASLDGSDGFLADEQAWAATLGPYMNGLSGASGGPTFTACQQPIGGDWFTFGTGSGTINGTLNANGSNKAGQQAIWSTLLYTTCSQNNTVPPPNGGGGGGGGAGATSWNPGDLVGVTLSNGNLTATATGAHQGVRSTTSQTTGKVCVEATASTISSNWTFGITNSTFPLNIGGGLGVDANGIGFDPNSGGGAQGIFYNNAALSTGSGASPNGEAETICVDLGAKLLWATNATMRAASHPWNNSTTASPATGTGGLSFAGVTCPCFATFNTDETPSVAVLNALGTFAVSTPSGFSAWQLPVTSGNHPIVINLGN